MDKQTFMTTVIVGTNMAFLMVCLFGCYNQEQRTLNKIYKEVVRMREIIEEDANDNLLYEKSEFMDRVVDYKLSFTETK